MPYISEIGLLDIDYETTISIYYYDKDYVDVINVPLKGDNAKQKISIDKNNVKQLRLDLSRYVRNVRTTLILEIILSTQILS